MKSVSAFVGASLLLLTDVSTAICPYELDGTPVNSSDASIPSVSTYNEALKSLQDSNTLESLFNDIYDLILSYQSCWPPDEFNGVSQYTGLFVRLAWHCSGTYRSGDGVGGCSGGMQRYEPQASWTDNTNLDKARGLLGGIKKKYGDSLSWGDLFIMAGTAAIYQGGGPVTEICAGRIDERNGSLSEVLNNTATCHPNGNCSLPLGTSEVGLIYVNPEGFMGTPDPITTASNVREVFSRMGMNDSETVALIGGGHEFGKSHGACPSGAGPNPLAQPYNPWPGACGTNFPNDTFTSGLEGQWTTDPFNWDNEYFTQLMNDKYKLEVGPGGKYQWTNENNGNMMFTTDYSLTQDNTYINIVKDYADDIDLFATQFDHAWAKLVTSGGFWSENMFCFEPDGYEITGHSERIDISRISGIVSTSSPNDPDTQAYNQRHHSSPLPPSV